ncbi:unnamed protein product [Brassica oleracea]
MEQGSLRLLTPRTLNSCESEMSINEKKYSCRVLRQGVQLVKLEKDPCAAFCFDHRSEITLDDANDVGMIQEADIGVGISGVQRMQFMTAQFRSLERLLMFMETGAING